MRVLLDTCVISELRRKNINPLVKRRIDNLADEDLFISVLSFGEITKGISLLENSKRKRELQAWLQTLESNFKQRILKLDMETAQIWGEMTADAKKHRKTIPAMDGLIAATARRHGLHLMTRNTTDFETTGALLINPWLA